MKGPKNMKTSYDIASYVQEQLIRLEADAALARSEHRLADADALASRLQRLAYAALKAHMVYGPDDNPTSRAFQACETFAGLEMIED